MDPLSLIEWLMVILWYHLWMGTSALTIIMIANLRTALEERRKYRQRLLDEQHTGRRLMDGSLKDRIL